MKSFYKYIRELWKSPKPIYKEKTRQWKTAFERIGKPTRLDRARSLGYKANKAFIVVRTRMGKGRRKRPALRKGRKPHSQGYFFTTKQSMQSIAEKRVNRKYPNMEVMNSYYCGENGKYKFYEVILIDPKAPEAKSNTAKNRRKRAFRGLTSASRRSRGLLK